MIIFHERATSSVEMDACLVDSRHHDDRGILDKKKN